MNQTASILIQNSNYTKWCNHCQTVSNHTSDLYKSTDGNYTVDTCTNCDHSRKLAYSGRSTPRSATRS